jgi:poly(3-hydroxybutyrate) depolymerase
MSVFQTLSVFQLVFCSLSLAISVAPPLKTYNVTAGDTSVSGLSSGGFMTVQFHMAHSATLRGAGVTAGGPYYCAQDSLSVALTTCLNTPLLIDVAKLVDFAKQAGEDGNIDPTSSLSQSRVFLISGTKDTTVKQEVMNKLYDFYSAFVSNIGKNYSIPAQHAQLTNDYGNECDVYRSPYIDNCNYPSGFVMLQFIYQDITYADNSKMNASNMLEFNQTEFFNGGSPGQYSMDSTGYVYVPTQCREGAACRLHIAFHGCYQGRGTIGDVFAVHAGYNGVAEMNNIIVLYPQVVKTTLTNPEGCWDWWGYTGKDYIFKTGPQISAVKMMLDKVAGTSQ